VYNPEPQDVRVSESEGAALEVGAKIIVRNRFLGTWTGGFRVAEVLPDGYRIQRFSDSLIFPDVFPPEAIRRDRRRENRGSHLDRRRGPGRWLAAPDELDPRQQWLLVPTEIEDD
jgi:hypothetical protein